MTTESIDPEHIHTLKGDGNQCLECGEVMQTHSPSDTEADRIENELRESIRKLVNRARVEYAYPESLPSDEYEDALKSEILALIHKELTKARYEGGINDLNNLKTWAELHQPNIDGIMDCIEHMMKSNDQRLKREAGGE